MTASSTAVSSQFFRCNTGGESIDINPFLVLQKGRGAFAVEALIVPSK